MIHKSLTALAILVFTATTFGSVTFYDDHAAFTAANAGNTLFGVDTFEENDYAPGSNATIAGEIRYNVPTTAFPTGLTLADIGVHTDGNYSMALLTEGFMGVPSDVVGSGAFPMATYVEEYAGDKVAIGMDVYELMGGSPVDIEVYDVQGGLLGSFVTAATDKTVPTFFGAIADVPIGQVKLLGQGSGAELIDNVETWVVPEPATLTLVVFGLLALRRR